MDNIQVTILPPAPAHAILSPEPQFGGHRYIPVSAETRIVFEDVGRMRLQTRKLFSGREITPPEWAADTNKMRAVLIRYLEIRSGSHGPQCGTEAERFRRALRRLRSGVPMLTETMDRLCRKYVDGKRNGEDPDRLRELEIEIKNRDTSIRMAKNLPEIVAGVIYRYFRLGENSVDVAAYFGLNPPAIRQLIYRLKKTAERLKTEPPPITPAVRARRHAARYYAALKQDPEKYEARKVRVRAYAREWIRLKRLDPAYRERRNAAYRARKKTGLGVPSIPE